MLFIDTINFLKFFWKKNFKFILYERGNLVLFNQSFILLLAKIDFFLKKKTSKKYTFITFRINCLKMILELVIKILAFYIPITIK